MIFHRMVVGPLDVNCYIVGSDITREVLVVDPGDEPDRIGKYLLDNRLTATAIVNTHGHIDHAGGVEFLKSRLNIPYWAHAGELPVLQALPVQSSQFGLYLSGVPAVDRTLAHNERISTGDVTFTVLHTPGHSPGSICLHGNGILLSGDTLFARSVGRTDLPGGDWDRLMDSLQNILMSLDDETKVYPGHGPATTIGAERKHNPFLH